MTKKIEAIFREEKLIVVKEALADDRNCRDECDRSARAWPPGRHRAGRADRNL